VDDVTIARALHVLAVVLWIGGVAFVTMVLLPAVRNIQASADRVVFFETLERRFSGQARWTTTLAGFTGFYMLVRLDLWDRFLSVAYWWMHAMVGVWFVFTLSCSWPSRCSCIDVSSDEPRSSPKRPLSSSSGCTGCFWR